MSADRKVPEIRFKGFHKEWFENKLGELIDIRSAARVHKKQWTEAGVPFFRTSDVISIYKGQNNSKAYIPYEVYQQLSEKIGRVTKNDLLITGGGSIGIPYLIRNDNPLYFKDADLLWLKNDKNFNGYFLYTFFFSKCFKKHIKSISHTGTIAHYTIEQAKATPINICNEEEQVSISNYFQKLDTLINQHQKKHDKLCNIKKAMLEKMFPKQGKTIPEIRFKDFSGQWEEKAIYELFTITRGNVLSANKTSPIPTTSMCYPVYSSQTKNNGLMGFYDKYLFETAITWTTDGANAGTVNFRDSKFYSTNVNGVLLSNKGYANKAIAEILNKEAWRHVSHVGNPKLMNNVMSTIKITIPNSIAEQNAISNYFQKLDNLINQHQQQITKLNNIKQACLSKMFV
ncbi:MULTISPECIES: restriction endonuclease subunit S [unclassified Gilliamella]|uniref:restriction endonuclease subunit S n=1 Tax=unclassified Gilliamella TaxID=2685620 RepID=UPI002269920A|nr:MULTISPECIES: restriction endonuclease subunit S [unclassified Gilliamella]MCX8583761.1 restriction endonuclease subunit S [Gilliamella sp. B3372]MCX8595030.1 restriction endonuclease subunit S [Gilliamella sp. B3367]